MWQLYVRFQSAPGDGKSIELYFVKSADGTTFEDGDATIVPSATSFVCAFPVRNVGTQQKIVVDKIALPPGKFKPLIRNNTSGYLTNTDNENVLSFATYDRTI
jgi:hypothetical protein